MELLPTSAADKALEETDIRTGMSLMQTVYAVAMTLGFKNAVEAAYGLFVPPTSSRPGALPLPVIAIAFLAVVLLAIRFFWVPRNLYSYVVANLDSYVVASLKEKEQVFKFVMVIHFPIVLAHALLFSFVCHAFVDMAAPPEHFGHASGGNLAFRFVALYAGLLLLNALWLLVITRRDDPEPGTVWAYNNLCCAWLVVGALTAFEKHELTTVIFVLTACVVFLVNSAVDLMKTAPYYILFEHRRARTGPTRASGKSS